MAKRLRELIGEKESLHKGLFSRLKDTWNSESNAKPLPSEPLKKLTPNLGQKPSEDGGVNVTKDSAYHDSRGCHRWPDWCRHRNSGRHEVF